MIDPAPLTDQQLRDRIAEAIWERQNPGRSFAHCEPRWRADVVADADVVLVVVQFELDRLRALLAHDHHLAYHQGEPRDNHVNCGRDSCQSTNELYPAAPSV